MENQKGREKLTLSLDERCSTCGGELIKGVQTRTYKAPGRLVKVEIYGDWCFVCGEGVVDDIDVIREAVAVAATPG